MSSSPKKQIKQGLRHSTKSIALVIGILLIAANLRASLTSVGPLIELIQQNLHISNTVAGMITTIPLFAFALFSLLIPILARKYSTELVLFYAVLALTFGNLLRPFAGIFGLFLGTAIIGLAISAGNVLLPSLIKKEFSDRVGFMTGIYTVTMNLFAALASGISIPLAVGMGLGWRGALLVWALLSIIAAIFWLPQIKRRKQLGHAPTPTKKAPLTKNKMWKLPLAWQVTFFVGLQSMVFYCMIAWLPDILIQHGMTASKAGWMLSLMQVATIPMNFMASIIAGRKSEQSSLTIIGSVLTLIGLLGVLLFGGSDFIFIYIILLGFGSGITFSLSMMFFTLRTSSPDEAAKLSGMAQSIGYLLAAFGPMFFGYLHDVTKNWSLPLIILIGLTVICFVSGMGASRNLYITKPQDS